MAPKRRIIENPPPASPSEVDDDEDEVTEGEEDADVTVKEPQNAVVAKDGDDDQEYDDDDDDDDEDEDDEENEESPTVKSTVTVTPTQSDTDPDPPSPSSFTIKPRISKPKPAKPVQKRPHESDPVPKESPATKKNKAADDEDAKKGSGFPRLWSDEDEIAILSGMLQYQLERGSDPNADMGAFHEFIKKSLHVDVSKNQLMDKIRRLKKKYQNYVESGENSQDPVFTKPHEVNSFGLSKKIWGPAAAAADNGNQNQKAKQSVKAIQNNDGGGGITLGLLASKRLQELIPSGKKQQKKVSSGRVKKEEIQVKKKDTQEALKQREEEDDADGEDLWEKHPCLRESLETEDLTDEAKHFLMEKLGRIDRGKLREMEGKWRRLRQAEVELFVQREMLINEQVKLVLDVIKSDEC